MIRIILLSLLIVVFIACEAANTQNVTIERNASEENSTSEENRSVEFIHQADLDDTLIELSGMITINGRLFAHNDGGDNTYLYELDVHDGNILRTIQVHNAWEADWEDIAQDDRFVYIADIGNNHGKRQSLSIYKIEKAELLTSFDVDAEHISFSYADQTKFVYGEHNTPYDAEALIAFGDSLYLFTKNWADYTTSVYPIPKEPGTYVVEKLAGSDKRFDVLITGATVDPDSGTVALVGYSDPFHPSGLLESKLILLHDYDRDAFFSGSIDEYTLSSGIIFRQYEAVASLSSDEFYVSGEGRKEIFPSAASLFKARIVTK